MTILRGAGFLLRHELRRDRLALLVTLVFFTYLALIVPTLDEPPSQMSPRASWLPDFMYFTFVPYFGFVVKKSMFRFWRDDPVSKRLASWLAMPISSSHIVLSRFLYMLLVLIPGIAYFFTMAYLISDWYKEEMSLGAFVNFGLFWFGYALIWSSIFVVWELTLSGKHFTWWCMTYVPVVAALAVLPNVWWGSVLESQVHRAKAGEWGAAILAVVIGLTVMIVCMWRARSRLERRNLVN
ncbi:ABC-2 transporter permease [Paenibacillus sp. IB182496]|uniref:ABC-2 transporter permease n=1 Tax=Paenibacillus sabuli TaxID=2772509 RepID=A0A927BWV1_9BACL|nr:ABC-2 transporter permease [Paenibacillus sabuli]MBD2847371.1 ABC-2 transporter permease [Paenibacillus sabuli]